MSHRRAFVSRRGLLSLSALSAVSLLFESRRGRAATPVSGVAGPVLVSVFLRGAADGLSIVIPYADDDYYRLRSSIAIPRPGLAGGAIDLDGRFGLHPRLAPLKAAFDAGELALLHAVGSPHGTRSHFEAQDYMETAAPGERAPSQGWLARYLKSRPARGPELLRALALTARAPLSLRGYPNAIVAPNLSDFRLDAGEPLQPLLTRGFERLYRPDSADLPERAGAQALDASGLLRRTLRGKRSGGYPRGARDFADLARLIKANVGVETACIDVGGWDTHRAQGRSEGGDLPRQLDRLGRALAAFRADLGADFERVLIVVMTEFGRTVRENGTGGTDHGHGSVMLLLGGSVKGGRVFGDFPGLADDKLHERRDLAVTTDFRDVLAEVCERHLGANDVARIFPGYQLDPSRRVGLFA